MKARHLFLFFLPHTPEGHQRAGTTEGPDARAHTPLQALQKPLEFR